jgi:hypothetical protein
LLVLALCLHLNKKPFRTLSINENPDSSLIWEAIHHLDVIDDPPDFSGKWNKAIAKEMIKKLKRIKPN